MSETDRCYGVARYVRGARTVTCCRFGTSFTWITPCRTRMNVPSQRSAVSQIVPLTVAEA